LIQNKIHQFYFKRTLKEIKKKKVEKNQKMLEMSCLSLNGKIQRKVPKVNLPVSYDLNNGKISQPQYLTSSIVSEVFWQWFSFS
jgi:hypothetical protein